MVKEIAYLPEKNDDIKCLLSYGERHPEYKFVDEDTTDFDTEKGFITKRVIIQRISDKKYFEAELLEATCGYSQYETEIIEVFPRQVTTTIYE